MGDGDNVGEAAGVVEGKYVAETVTDGSGVTGSTGWGVDDLQPASPKSKIDQQTSLQASALVAR